MRLSVIIPAFNEEKYIAGCLGSFSRQSFSDFELIVVDNASTDRTSAIARRYARVITEPLRGASFARNAGARVAKGEILVFVDADCVVSQGFLKAIDACMIRGVVGVTGPILPGNDWVNERLFCLFVWSFLSRLLICLGLPMFPGANCAYHRDVFSRASFRHMPFGEDIDLSKRVRHFGRFVFCRDAVLLTHLRRFEQRGFLRETVRWIRLAFLGYKGTYHPVR